jgi:hypothetical protein
MEFKLENFNTGSKMNKLIGLLPAVLLITIFSLGDALGRGFGGCRGGFGGANFGGSRGGGFDRGNFGGFSDRGFDTGRSGGFSGRSFDDFQGRDMGRWQGEAYHSEPTRSFSGDRYSRPSGFDNDRIGAADGASRGQLDRFLGLPTDAGLGHVAPARAGEAFEGTRVTAGRVEGPLGGSAAFVSGTHVGYVPPNIRSAQGWTVRNAFDRYNLFTPAWYTAHRGAWTTAALAASTWAPASWSSAADWVGCDLLPEDYDYGSTVLYQGGNVYVEGQPAGSEAQYYDQAGSLAASGDTKQEDQADWLSLGVFGMVQGQQTDPTMIFQLAVNHQGIIRGNFYNTMTDTTLPVHGAVDKKTQRVSWTMGDNKSTIIDTGLANLTKDEGPALVHIGKDKTQEWLLVRLKGKSAAKQD